MLSSEERTEQEPIEAGTTTEPDGPSSATASADDEDLIGQMMGGGEVPSDPSSDCRMVEDVVSVMDEIQAAHGKHCPATQFFTNKFGQVYCLDCGSNVGSIADISDSFCPKCGCANSAHMNGKCLMLVEGQPCPCSDAHEFTESNWTRQQQEAKQWLQKREARKRKRQSEATPTS